MLSLTHRENPHRFSIHDRLWTPPMHGTVPGLRPGKLEPVTSQQTDLICTACARLLTVTKIVLS